MKKCRFFIAALLVFLLNASASANVTGTWRASCVRADNVPGFATTWSDLDVLIFRFGEEDGAFEVTSSGTVVPFDDDFRISDFSTRSKLTILVREVNGLPAPLLPGLYAIAGETDAYNFTAINGRRERISEGGDDCDRTVLVL